MARRSKYGNKRVELDGYKFDSIAESLRYQELKLLLFANEIHSLKVHPRYCLQFAFQCEGKCVRAIFYIADFEYYDNRIWRLVTEDVKGVQTAVFRLKHKMFQKRFGRTINIVYAK